MSTFWVVCIHAKQLDAEVRMAEQPSRQTTSLCVNRGTSINLREAGHRANITGGLIGVFVPVVIYQVPIFSTALRWILTIIGFAAPLALGVMTIQYVVEETSAPI